MEAFSGDGGKTKGAGARQFSLSVLWKGLFDRPKNPLTASPPLLAVRKGELHSAARDLGARPAGIRGDARFASASSRARSWRCTDTICRESHSTPRVCAQRSSIFEKTGFAVVSCARPVAATPSPRTKQRV